MPNRRGERPVIRIFDDPDTLSRAAAEQITVHIEAVLQEDTECRIALSGGGTPQQTYRLLAREPFRSRIAWAKLVIFWGDERCVPSGDARHNATQAFRSLLDHVPVDSARVHPIVCDVSPRSTARAYEELLQRQIGTAAPALDLTLLGMGADGHTASLFPRSRLLHKAHRWVAEVFQEEEKMHRITMTPVLLNQSAQILFLVSGSAKSATLKQVLEDPYDPINLPAQSIKPQQGRCTWMVDRAAAAKLNKSA